MKKTLLGFTLIGSIGTISATGYHWVALPFGVAGFVQLMFSGNMGKYVHANSGSVEEAQAGITLAKCLGLCATSAVLVGIGNVVAAKRTAAAQKLADEKKKKDAEMLVGAINEAIVLFKSNRPFVALEKSVALVTIEYTDEMFENDVRYYGKKLPQLVRAQLAKKSFSSEEIHIFIACVKTEMQDTINQDLDACGNIDEKRRNYLASGALVNWVLSELELELFTAGSKK